MLAARLKNIFFILLATQITSVSMSFVIWCYIVLGDGYGAAKDALIPVLYLTAAFFISSVCFLIFFYQRMMQFRNVAHSVTLGSIIKAEVVVLATSGALSLAALVSGTANCLLIIWGFALTTMVLILLLHLLASDILCSVYNHPRNKLKVLVLGMNPRAEEFCQIIKDTAHLGAEVHGYLDVHEIKGAPVKYLGDIDQLGVILRAEVIDMASIFLPVRTFYDTISDIIEVCDFYGVTSYIVGNVFEATAAKKNEDASSISDFGNMAFSSTAVDFVGLAQKRAFDFVAALAGLIVLSPLMLGVAIFIKIVSKGPIFFSQERVGLNKRIFRMLKFRTMVPNAESMQEQLAAMNEMDGPAFKITNDPRLIRGGAFLRRHSLDELPQLWNVLKGDMSVVGPRPLSRRDYDRMEDDWQRKRFSMRPGLTCTWQTSGRNNVSFPEWMQMDLNYIDKWRLGEDFRLILETMKIVLVGTGK